MKSIRKILTIMIFLIVVCILGTIIIFSKNNKVTIRAIVVEVNEKYLEVMGLDSTNSLYTIEFSSNGNLKFKQGQEVLIYYNNQAIIEQSGGTIRRHDIKEIKIVKEKSDTEIPSQVLKRVFSSPNNISISINEISTNGISLTIKDTNKYKYEYSNSYRLDKKKHNSSKGALWEEVSKISNGDKVMYSTDIDNNTIVKICNWESIHCKLESGEYQFTTSTLDNPSIHIIIEFTIDENGKISYNKPTFFIM